MQHLFKVAFEPTPPPPHMVPEIRQSLSTGRDPSFSGHFPPAEFNFSEEILPRKRRGLDPILML
jgi:hypothetical protein